MSPDLAKRRLAEILRERGVLDVADAVDITLDVCEALATLHAQDVVHGDLAPGCILVPWPYAPMSDAVDIFAGAARDELSLCSHTFGAPLGLADREYAAPEQRESTSSVDIRADIWTVGALLRRMIAGVTPAGGGGRSGCDLPSGLAHVVEACLATDPAARPLTIDDVAGRIASFSSAPPEHYARLAYRRAVSGVAPSAVKDPLAATALDVLERLDDKAIDRELAPSRSSAAPAAIPSRVTMLPPETAAASALAPLWTLGDETPEQSPAARAWSYAPAPVHAPGPVARSASPSFAPVQLSIPPEAPGSLAPHRAHRYLPVLAYAAVLTLSAVFVFQFAAARSMSASAREAAPDTAPPAAHTAVPVRPALPGLPGAQFETKSLGVPGPTPAAAAPIPVTTPNSLREVSVRPRPRRVTRSATKASERAEGERSTMAVGANDSVLLDAERR